MQTQSTLPQTGMPSPTVPPTTGNGHDEVRTVPKAEATRSGVAREFHHLLADIEDLIREMTSLTGADLARAKTRLVAQIAAARQSAGAMGDVINEKAHKSAALTNSYVHEKPWTAIGIGAGAGLLLGVLLARR